jgi:acyl carrier protein
MTALRFKVRGLIAGHFGMAPDRLTDKSRLRDDLGADRFDRIEFVIAVEDQLAGVEIDDGRRDHRIRCRLLQRESPLPAQNRHWPAERLPRYICCTVLREDRRTSRNAALRRRTWGPPLSATACAIRRIARSGSW